MQHIIGSIHLSMNNRTPKQMWDTNKGTNLDVAKSGKGNGPVQSSSIGWAEAMMLIRTLWPSISYGFNYYSNPCQHNPYHLKTILSNDHTLITHPTTYLSSSLIFLPNHFIKHRLVLYINYRISKFKPFSSSFQP